MKSYHSTAKKLFFVVDTDRFFLSHRLPIALKAKQEGYDVTVVSTDTGLSPCIISQGIRFIPQQFLRTHLDPFNELKIIRKLYRLYKVEKPDIVHHVAIKMIMNGSVAAKFAGIKCVVNAVAGLGYYFLSPLKQLLFVPLFSPFFWIARSIKHSQYIFQNSDDRDLFLRFGWANPRKISMIKGSGIDLEEYAYTDPPKESPLIVLMASRLIKAKGVQEFVDAAREIKGARGLQVRFIMVGDLLKRKGEITESDLLAWTNDKIIEWHGYQENILPLLQQSHIHVLPSYREGLPKSLIESCAVGRPIVSTNVPGCRDVVEDGSNGLLVPARDAHALANAIINLMSDKELRMQMGKAAREKAVKEFDIQSVVKKTLDIYQTLLFNPTL